MSNGSTPSPSQQVMDPVRPDLIPMSDPMNHHHQLLMGGGGGGPLDLSGGPPFPFLHHLAPATTSSILGHLAAKAGGLHHPGLHPDLHSLGMLLPPNSMALNGKI
jgi:hypothetical protein